MKNLQVLSFVIVGTLILLIFGDLFWWTQMPQNFLISGSIVLFLILLTLIFVRTTDLKESSAKAITRGGSFSRMVFSKKGHYLNKDCDLVPNKSYEYSFWGMEWLGKLLGGKRFYIWLLEQVHTYDWEWVKVLPNRTLKPKEDKGVDHILVGQIYTYGLQIKGRGIVTTNKVPVEVSVALPTMIINPRKALFDVKSWFNSFIGRIQPAIRDYINSNSYDFIISGKGELDDLIFEELKRRNIIKELDESFGIKLTKLEFLEIKPTDEYQEIVTKELEGKMEAEKRLATTTGTFVAMLAKETALEPEHLARILRNPVQAKKFRENNKEAIARSRQFVERQVDAATPGALKSFHFKGAKGGEHLIALLGEALRGGTGSSPSEASSSSKPASPRKEDKYKRTDEELAELDRLIEEKGKKSS